MQAKGANEPAMFTPVADFLCVGGASILVALWVLAAGVRLPAQSHWLMHLTNFAINAPHFLVSYRLLYGSPRRRSDYRAVSVYVPAALAVYLVFALAICTHTPQFLGAMIGVGTLLLAWHYTGQAYGMIASFAFLAGLRLSATERHLLRANLYVLLAWHVGWALVAQRDMFNPTSGGSTLLAQATAAGIYRWMTLAALASSVCGLAALGMMVRRTGRLPTLRMVAPWVAIHLWYVLLYREPAAIFWAQNAHALQYLLFPMRVEMNRSQAETANPERLGKHMLAYYLGTVVLGLIVMQLMPEFLQLGIHRLGYGSLPVQLGIVAFVNIHHYFIDNFIWKLRNPVVRRELFAHVPSPAS